MLSYFIFEIVVVTGLLSNDQTSHKADDFDDFDDQSRT